MKSLFKLTALLMIVLVIASCKKDKDDDKASVNSFKYDGKEYKLTQGYLENYGQWWGEAYNLDLTLLSEGFTVSQAQGGWITVTGEGHGIYFEMYSDKSNELVAGEYVFDEDSYEAGTFEFGDFVIDYNIMNETGQIVEITGGKLTVKKSGSEYEITFDCTTETGKNITGSYKGSLDYYNYDLKKSDKTKTRTFDFQ